MQSLARWANRTAFMQSAQPSVSKPKMKLPQMLIRAAWIFAMRARYSSARTYRLPAWASVPLRGLSRPRITPWQPLRRISLSSLSFLLMRMSHWLAHLTFSGIMASKSSIAHL